MAVLVDITVGVRAHHQPEGGDGPDLRLIGHIQMPHDPALALDRHDLVYRFEVIEELHPDGGDADVVARGFYQHVAH